MTNIEIWRCPQCDAEHVDTLSDYGDYQCERPACGWAGVREAVLLNQPKFKSDTAGYARIERRA